MLEGGLKLSCTCGKLPTWSLPVCPLYTKRRSVGHVPSCWLCDLEIYVTKAIKIYPRLPQNLFYIKKYQTMKWERLSRSLCMTCCHLHKRFYEKPQTIFLDDDRDGGSCKAKKKRVSALTSARATRAAKKKKNKRRQNDSIVKCSAAGHSLAKKQRKQLAIPSTRK